MAQNNASQFYKITIHQNVSQSDMHAVKPPKIDHAKILINNVLLIFSIINFLLPCLFICKLLRDML